MIKNTFNTLGDGTEISSRVEGLGATPSYLVRSKARQPHNLLSFGTGTSHIRPCLFIRLSKTNSHHS